MHNYQTRTNRELAAHSGLPSGSTPPGDTAPTRARAAYRNSGRSIAVASLAAATRRNLVNALAVASSAIAVSLFALNANAEITEDCILEGTVDMRMAEQLGQPVYVRFRNAERGSEARCSLNRRGNSRRVQFISSPDEHDLDNARHGDRVRYRYTERDGNPGTWELIEVKRR